MLPMHTNPATSPPSTNASAPPRLRGESSFSTKLKTFAADIKLSHTLFALPWALLAIFLAAGGFPKTGQLLLILLCMVAARTMAMASNRLLDARLDALNPRTARRALPSGQLSPAFMIAIAVACIVAFLAATALFYFLYRNLYPLLLAIPVLAFISAYPLLKRFTRLCHYYLGAALALAPICAYLAIAATLTLTPILMAAAVLLWTAGFDILYATADYESDRATGVFSIPSRLGIPAALWIARLTHLLCAALLLLVAYVDPQLNLLYTIAALISIILLIVEHSLVTPNDLSRLNLAFFTLNGLISLLLGTLGILDVFF